MPCRKAGHLLFQDGKPENREKNGRQHVGHLDALASTAQHVQRHTDQDNAADGGHLQTYGGGVLILLNNPVMVMDPAKGCSNTYQSIQMNYATASIQNVKITLGYAPDLSAEAYDEVYLSHGNTFYLRGCTNLVNGNSFCTLTGVVEGCLYSVVAYDPEAAKQMIDSLIQA